jgi:hypothetical protein
VKLLVTQLEKMDQEYDKCGQTMATGEVSGFGKELLECHCHPSILNIWSIIPTTHGYNVCSAIV